MGCKEIRLAESEWGKQVATTHGMCGIQASEVVCGRKLVVITLRISGKNIHKDFL